MAGETFSYEWIDNLPQMEGVARILGQAKIIGVDLEADSMHHYSKGMPPADRHGIGRLYHGSFEAKGPFRFTTYFLQSPHPQSIPRGGF